MKYFSTRGGDEELTFEEAVLTGLAPNGGLFIPTHIPALPSDWQTAWSSYTFTQLSHAILSLYISPTEISSSDLLSLITDSYKSFRHPEITPLKKINGELYILELWHGPTFAFKDVALQLLGNLFEFFLRRRNLNKHASDQSEKLTVLGATSGDTGSAAIYGLRSKADISIFILHPKGRVSPIQEAQMTTVTDSNVHNVAVKGTFDDCQDIVKTLFSDKKFNAAHHLGAINSINWARILAQTVYYFLAYFQLQKLQFSSAPIQFVVPTGNFGDVLAGFYAKKMGLPIAKLGIGTNSNDILARFWKSGRYEKTASPADVAEGAAAPAAGSSDGKQSRGEVKETLSPAMDIMVSSNFERLLWYLAFDSLSDGEEKERRGKASKMVKDWMDSVKSDGRAVVSVDVLEKARSDFIAERVDDELTLDTIRKFYHNKDGISYIADPHTAVGLAAASIFQSTAPSPKPTQIVLSTAHPAKFSEAVTRALGSSIDFERDVLPEEFKGLLDKPRRVIDVEGPDAELVKDVIERFAQGGTVEVGSSV